MVYISSWYFANVVGMLCQAHFFVVRSAAIVQLGSREMALRQDFEFLQCLYIMCCFVNWVHGRI